MESILELLKTASEQLKGVESTLQEIAQRESSLDAELEQIKDLSGKIKAMNESVRKKRIDLINKLSHVLLQTVGSMTYRIKKDGVYIACVFSATTIIDPTISYRLGSDPDNRTRMQVPEFFTKAGYERAYYCLCYSMIMSLKNYFKLNPSLIEEQSRELNELGKELSSLTKP